MKEGLAKYYTGDWNVCSSVIMPDGSEVITLSKYGENKVYRFRVKNLYQENQEVLEEEIKEIEIPEHIKKFMDEAQNIILRKVQGQELTNIDENIKAIRGY